MSRPDDFGRLQDSDYAEFRQIVARYERALASAPARARIEAYLPEGPESLRLAIICELIKTDLEHRWKKGKQVFLEEYLARFPELQGKTDISGLVFEEFLIQHECGYKPDLQDIKRRFPTHYDACKRLAEKAGMASSVNPSNEATSVSDPEPAAVGICHYNEGAVLFERFTLTEYLDSGTFGQVWKAQDRDGSFVAIKIPKEPLNKKQTMKELEALTQIQGLHHEYLLQTKSFWVEKNYLFIAMELADGGTLKDRLKDHKSRGHEGIPVQELLPYFQGTARALDFLHSQNMVHRDVKPANILLVGGQAKIADFGLLRKTDLLASQSHTVVGSYAYMAPEMMRGHASASSDQYCFAVTYVELRQGRLPYPTNNIEDLFKRDELDLRSLDAREQHVVERALQKERHQRYASCQEFVSELAEAVKSMESFPVEPAPPPPRKAEEAPSKPPAPNEWDDARAKAPKDVPTVKKEPHPSGPVPAHTATVRRQDKKAPATKHDFVLGAEKKPKIFPAPQTQPDLDIAAKKDNIGKRAPKTQSDIEVPPAAPVTKPVEKPAPVVLQPKTGLVLRQRYVLKEYLGKGGFGSVWLAQDLRDNDELVAVKISTVPFSDKEQLAKEVDALKRIRALRNDCLLETRDYWDEDDHLIIVMEFADGGTLTDRLAWHKQQGGSGIPRDELLTYFRDTAQGLDYLHQQKMVHRDVKPLNILLVRNQAKLADFGLLRVMDLKMSVAFTPAYMPPEMDEERPSDKLSDQFCFAVSYVEMRQGRLPFRGMARDNPDLASLEAREQAVLRRALAVNPAERYPSCGDFIRDLSRACEPPPPPKPILGKLLVAALVLLGLGLGAWFYREKQRCEEEIGTILAARSYAAAAVRFDACRLFVSPDLGERIANEWWPLLEPTSDDPPARLAELLEELARFERHFPPRKAEIDDRRALLTQMLTAKDCEQELDRLVLVGDFAGVAKRYKDACVPGPVHERLKSEIQQPWREKLDAQTKSNQLSLDKHGDKLPANADVLCPELDQLLADLRACRDELAVFEGEFPQDPALHAPRNRNEETASALLKLAIEKRNFPFAIKIFTRFNKELAQQGQKIADVWWARLEPADGAERKKLQELRTDLAEFARCFADQPGLGTRRLELDARIEVDELVQAEKFQAALEGMQKCPTVAVRDKMKANIQRTWLERVKNLKATTRDELKARRDELAMFGTSFPDDKAGTALRQDNDAAILALFSKNLNEASLEQALDIARTFELADQAKKVEATWWARFDLKGVYDDQKLQALHDDLPGFEKNFPQRRAEVDQRRTAIATRLKETGNDGKLLTSAKTNIENMDYLSALGALRNVQAQAGPNALEKASLARKAEQRLAQEFAQISRTKPRSELRDFLARFDSSGLALEDRLDLDKYRLEVAWLPFAGKVTKDDLTSTAQLLAKIGSKPAIASDANFKALQALLAVYADEKAVDTLVNLARVNNPPPGYHEYLVKALTHLEADRKVLSFQHLFTLEKALTDKLALSDILLTSPQRLLEKGWTPEPKWQDCLAFCDAVDPKQTNNWLRALRAECQVTLSPKEVLATRAEFNAGWYGLYVEALLRQEKNRTDAANFLLAGEKSLASLAPVQRRDRARQLLTDAAHELPRREPLQLLFVKKQDAQQALSWLDLTRRLDTPKARPYTAHVDRLLAVAQKDNTDVASTKLLEEVLQPAINLGWTAAKERDERLVLAKLHSQVRQGLVDNLAAVEKWTKNAAPNHYGKLALNGVVKLERARQIEGKIPLLGGGKEQIDALQLAQQESEAARKAADADGMTPALDRAAIDLDLSRQELELGRQLHKSTFDKSFAKHYEKALEFAQLSLKAIPNAPAALQAEGDALEAQQEFGKALQAFDLACQKAGADFDQAAALLGKFRCQLAMDRKSLDVASLQQAVKQLKLPSHKASALLLLARVQVNDKDVRQSLDEAVMQQPGDLVFFDAAQVCYERAKVADIGQALPWIDRGEEYLGKLKGREQSSLAELRRKLVFRHFELSLKMPPAARTDIFDLHLRKDRDASSNVCVIVQRFVSASRVDDDLKPLDDAVARAGKLAAAQNLTSIYPKEYVYWLKLQHEALAVTVQLRQRSIAKTMLDIGKKEGEEKQLEWLKQAAQGNQLRDILGQSAQCEKIRRELEKYTLKPDMAWLPLGVQSYVHYLRFLRSANAQDLELAKAAIKECLQLEPPAKEKETYESFEKGLNTLQAPQ